MIPHILRKDLKLLWKPALGIAITYLLTTVFFVWRFDRTISEAVSISLYIAAFFLLVTVVQLDPIPGDRADWLTRPIPRGELLGAKLLFAFVTLVGPMLLVNITVALATGFGFGEVLKAALSHGSVIFLGLVMPVMALASVTRNISQCLIVVAVVALGQALSFELQPSNFQINSLKWMEDAALLLIGFAAACAILTLQYRRRMTRTSVAIVLATCLCVAINARIPWKNAWNMQARLSSNHGEALQLRFDPKHAPFQLADINGTKPPKRIYLPVQFDGWQKDLHLLESASLRLRMADGTVRDSSVDPRDLPRTVNAPFLPFDFEGAPLPTENVSAAITAYFLSSKQLGSSTIEVNGKAHWLPYMGRCRATPLRTAVSIECSQVGDPALLVQIYDGGYPRGRLSLSTDPLAPFFLRCVPSIFTRSSTTLNTFAPAAPFSSPEPGPPPPFLELRPLHVEGLIERRLEIPNFRVNDWTLH